MASAFQKNTSCLARARADESVSGFLQWTTSVSAKSIPGSIFLCKISRAPPRAEAQKRFTKHSDVAGNLAAWAPGHNYIWRNQNTGGTEIASPAHVTGARTSHSANLQRPRHSARRLLLGRWRMGLLAGRPRHILQWPDLGNQTHPFRKRT
jgi:hypothetical protein